jgi:hypothetical protein
MPDDYLHKSIKSEYKNFSAINRGGADLLSPFYLSANSLFIFLFASINSEDEPSGETLPA